MINIEEIQTQIDSLQRCVNNYKLTENLVKSVKDHPENKHFNSRYEFATDQLIHAEQTIIGQIKVNCMQNEKLLKP